MTSNVSVPAKSFSHLKEGNLEKHLGTKRE